jgi:hypothetical protein
VLAVPPDNAGVLSDTTQAENRDSAQLLSATTAEPAVDPFAAWVQAIDQTSGRPYYYNTATQESTWVNPRYARLRTSETGITLCLILELVQGPGIMP